MSLCAAGVGGGGGLIKAEVGLYRWRGPLGAAPAGRELDLDPTP